MSARGEKGAGDGRLPDWATPPGPGAAGGGSSAGGGGGPGRTGPAPTGPDLAGRAGTGSEGRYHDRRIDPYLDDRHPVFANAAAHDDGAYDDQAYDDGRYGPTHRRGGSHRGERRGTGFALGLLGALILVVAAVTLVGASRGSGHDDRPADAAAPLPARTTGPLTAGASTGPAIPTPATVSPTARPVIRAVAPAPVRTAAPATSAGRRTPSRPHPTFRTPHPSRFCRDLGWDPPSGLRRYWEKQFGVTICRHGHR